MSFVEFVLPYAPAIVVIGLLGWWMCVVFATVEKEMEGY